jgi:hypothetical protein
VPRPARPQPPLPRPGRLARRPRRPRRLRRGIGGHRAGPGRDIGGGQVGTGRDIGGHRLGACRGIGGRGVGTGRGIGGHRIGPCRSGLPRVRFVAGFSGWGVFVAVFAGCLVVVRRRTGPRETRIADPRLNRRQRRTGADILKLAGDLRVRRRLVGRSGIASRAVARAHGLHCTGDHQTGRTPRLAVSLRRAVKRWATWASGNSAGTQLRPVPSLTSSFTNYTPILPFTGRIMGAT